MIPDPLHPAVVHFPVVLAVLAPVIALAALWAIGRGSRPRMAWGIATVAFAALAGSAFVATRTGEDQEDRVEQAVPEQALESHEESGTQFMYAAVAVLVLAAAGLAPGGLGKVARIGATAGSIVVLAMGYRVGESGGELVYRHGAGSAYTQPGVTQAGGEKDDD